MKKMGNVLIMMLSLILLSGCAGLVKSRVTVFHQFGETSIPKTYLFVPMKGQKSSLEYKTYIELVRQQLNKFQYRETAQNEAPDVIIVLNYGIDSGKEKSMSFPVYGQTGVSSSTTHGTLNTYGNHGTYSGTTTYIPTYGVVGSSTMSATEYTRGLWLYIVDAKSVGTKDLNVLYEASVKSSGSSDQLPCVMPAMIEALFKEFPGKNGDTRTEITAIPQLIN